MEFTNVTEHLSICLAPCHSLSPLGGLIFRGAYVQNFIFISVAICTNACVNGTCSTPDTCSCNAGFYGQICDRGEHFKSFYLHLKSSPSQTAGTQIKVNKTHMCMNLGFFPGISSCKCQKVDMMKSQLSFVDCFTVLA